MSTPRYDDSEFLDALDQTRGHATTSRIAWAVGCSMQTANRRLRALADEGELEFMTSYPDHQSATSRELIVRSLRNGEEPITPPEKR